MNKSKFLKKSLAAILAVLMIVAVVPLSAAAADATLSLKEARVVTDVDTSPAWLQVDEENGTITGSISNTATLFQLQLLPDDASASVNYQHVPDSDRPNRAMTQDSTTGIWHTGTLLHSGATLASTNGLSVKDFTTGGSLTFKTKLVKGDEEKEYTVTLNSVANAVDNSVINFEVWAANDTYKVADSDDAYAVSQGKGAQTQIGSTRISKDAATIDITVPYDAESIWVRDIQLGNGARASVNGTTIGNDSVLVQNTAANDGNKWSSNKNSVTMLVEAGGMRTTYTVTFTRASGFESFTGKEAIDSRIFSEDGKIVVVLPYGTAADAGSGKIKFTPEFALQFADTEVPTLKIRPATATGTFATSATTLKTGETTVDLLPSEVSTAYNYKNPAKRINSSSITNFAGLTEIASAKVIAKVDVAFVEGTTRTYDLIAVEADYNYQSVIDELQIGTETATIDQSARTIDITLPHGTDLTKIPANAVKITASANATITAPFQTNSTFSTTTAANTRKVWDDKFSNAGVLNLSTPTTLRVVSQDAGQGPTAPYTGNTTLYTLNVHVSDSYVMPALTSVTLRDKKGNDYKGVLSTTNGYNLYTITVPYSTRITDNLSGWKLFYDKSIGSAISAKNAGGTEEWNKTGATITGREAFLFNGNTGANVISTNGSANIAANRGSVINVTSSVLGDNENAKDEYYIVLVRAQPNHNSKLTSVTLAANGETSPTVANNMAEDELNAENSFTASPDATNTITVELPWSYLIQNGETPAGGDITYNDVVNALRAKIGLQNENATVWYETSTADTYEQIVTIPETTEAQTVLSFWDTTNKQYVSLKLAVLSEQVSTDITGESDYTAAVAGTSAATVANFAATVVPAINAPVGDITYYTIKLKDDVTGLKGNYLTSLSLVDPATGRKAPLTVSGDKITGSVPYGMTKAGTKLYLEYNASPRAFVVGVEDGTACYFDATSGKLTEFDEDAGKVGPGYPTGYYVGHFDNWSVWGDSSAKTCENELLPYGGAYVVVDRNTGTVTPYNSSNTAANTTNKLYVCNEDVTVGYSEYTLSLTVATPNTEPTMTSFTLDGQRGTIDNDADTITVTVPSTSDLKALKAEWTLATGATLTQGWTSGDKMNFTTERLFTVLAENEKARKTYRVIVTQSSGFYDVPEGIWFYDDVMTAFKNNWIKGTGEGLFSPYGMMKRGDFAQIIANIMEYDAAQYPDSSFLDVPTEMYYSAAIAFCADKGYINGFGDSNFGPENAITREQAAVIMCNAAGLTPVNGSTAFADDASIADWAKPYINACVNAGIFTGKDGNRFDPKANLKRCEGAALLVRAFNK